jgi:rare lipoprotein A
MRRRSYMRESRLVHVAVGASILAGPASAAALGDAQSGIQVWLKSHRVAYGRDVVLTGRVRSAQPGEIITLEFAPSGSGVWRPIASSVVRGDRSFRLAAPASRSGAVRVVTGPQAGGSTASPMASSASAGGASGATAPERVSVAAGLQVGRRAIGAVGGHRVTVRGRLLPAGPWRPIVLQTWSSGGWTTVASSRTGARGGFALRYWAGGAGRRPLRVHFAGDSANGAASRRVGELTVFRQSLASWYDDGGTTACGFHAYYGVANLSLPCGAKVTFRNNGRTVTAVVDDRGPYVGGREWDLNQNTAAALGFGGVGTVWSSP